MGNEVFITAEQVRAACAALNISDWSARTDPVVDESEAEIIRNAIGHEASRIPVSDFRYGLEVELEHGTRTPECNVSNNHPLVTGRIVLAHLKEGLDYYLRLRCMELEMEITGALADGDPKRAVEKRRELSAARETLERRIGELLSTVSSRSTKA